MGRGPSDSNVPPSRRHSSDLSPCGCRLAGATLAVLIDPVLRFSDYRALLHLLPVAGTMKFSVALTLVFLQVVALFYLILLLPRILRAAVLLLFVFVVVVQFSYWLTLSQFMTATDLFLGMSVGGDHRTEAVSSFFQPLVFLYAIPLRARSVRTDPRPPGSDFRKTLALSLLPVLYLLASNYALFLHVPERSFHLNPLTSFLRSTLQSRV